MQRIWNRAWLIGAAPLAVAAVVGGTVVLADDDPTPAGESAFAVNIDEDGPFSGFLAALATKLGISEDQLKEAIKQTGLEQLDKAVADGTIPQEMADRLRERIEAGDGHFFGMPVGGMHIEVHGGPGGKHGAKVFGMGVADNGVAEFLGITQEQLRDELNAGQTLAEVAETHGKSRDDLKAFLIAQHKTHLDEAVADGNITQAQADEKAAAFAENVDEMIDAEMRIHIREESGMPPAGMPMGGTIFRGPFGGMTERGTTSSSSTLN